MRFLWIFAAATLLAGCASAPLSSSSSTSCDAHCQANLAAAMGSDTPSVTVPVPVAKPPAPHRPTIQQDIVRWYSGISADFDAIQSDEGDIATAAGNMDVAALNVACSSLKQDVITFESDPPSPDAQERRDLAHAMDAYSTSASACLSADYQTSAAESNRGTAWIQRATRRVKQLAGG